MRSMCTAVALLVLTGCGGESAGDEPAPGDAAVADAGAVDAGQVDAATDAAPTVMAGVCADVVADPAEVATEDGLRDLLAEIQAVIVPELDGVIVGLATMEAESDFFVANLDFSTLTAPPLERHYLVRYNPVLLDDPPPPEAVVAILVHELKHVLDYTEMDTQAFIDFGLEVLTGDASAYERATDEFALERGCAEGLKGYRSWLYARIDEEAQAEKRRNYYTPEEIDAWVAANRP